MKCRKCGANLPNGAVFCGNCGTKFNYNVCRRCGAPLRPGDPVCRNCGQPTGMKPPQNGKGTDQIVLFVAIGIAAAVAFTIAVVAVFFVFNHNSSNKIAKTAPTPTVAVTTPAPVVTNPPTEPPAPTPQIVYVQGQNPAPAVPPVQAPRSYGGSYIFPTDSVYLSTSDLNGRSRDQVRLMLNEIYARHGYIFSTSYYRNYFSSQSWYVPVSSNESYITSQFNSIERYNKEFIASYEKSMGWR